jgi:hypothetical protein
LNESFRELPWLADVVRAKRPARVPVVLSRDELRRVLGHLEGWGWRVRREEPARLRLQSATA